MKIKQYNASITDLGIKGSVADTTILYQGDEIGRSIPCVLQKKEKNEW